MQDHIAILILAAGSATRMGEPKQLLPFKGTTLLGHVIHTSSKLNLGAPFVVLGAEAEEIKLQHADSPAEWLVNRSWQEGMGTSIVSGLKAIIQQRPELPAVLILLADQPLISAEYLGEMLLAFQNEEVALVATQYREGPGVPVLIGKSLFPEILDLKGDQGARKILLKHAHQAKLLLNATGVVDIDYPEDYLKLRKLE